MPFALSEFNWQLIIIVVAISAFVSYVGDILGMKIGKKRISLFGLRPKYTSTVITLFTGMGVAVLTLIFAAWTSDSIQGALFRAKYLQREIQQRTESLHDMQEQLNAKEFELDDMHIQVFNVESELDAKEKALLAASDDLRQAALQVREVERESQELGKEKARLSEQLDGLKAEKASMEKAVASLRAETDQLKKGLAEMKEGRVVAFQGELLAQTSIENNASRANIDNALTRLIQAAQEALVLRRQNAQNVEGSPRVVIDADMRKKVVSSLLSAKGRKVLRLTASSNIVQGQAVTGVVTVFDSKLVFPKDTVLMREAIKRDLQPEAAADVLYTMLRNINRKAVSQGVLPDPISGAVGNLDSLEFYDAVDQISEPGKKQSVSFLAARDIYTEGPVDIKIVVVEEK